LRIFHVSDSVHSIHSLVFVFACLLYGLGLHEFSMSFVRTLPKFSPKRPK